MQPILISYQWQPREGVSPRIESAVVIAGAYPRSLVKCQQSCWVLDYEFNSFGRTGVRGSSIAWLDRAPQTAHLYPPGVTYWEDSRLEKGTRHSGWIHFRGGAESGLASLVEPGTGFARLLDESGDIGAIVTAIAKAGNDWGEPGFWKAQQLLCRLIDVLSCSRPSDHGEHRISAGGEPAKRSGLVDETLRYIGRNLCGKLSLDEIARSANVSVSSLAHRYRRETGETVMTTVARLRVERAKLLLVKGTPLKTIADLLGFSDAFHLSRTFKQQVGMAPSAFRKVPIGGR